LTAVDGRILQICTGGTSDPDGNHHSGRTHARQKAELTKDKRSLSAAPIVIQYQRASVDLLNAQLRTVCFGSLAASFINVTLTAASGGKADVLQLEISWHPQIKLRVSAYPDSGRADLAETTKTTGS
jgi:hypothetical protein